MAVGPGANRAAAGWVVAEPMVAAGPIGAGGGMAHGRRLGPGQGGGTMPQAEFHRHKT
jgi:hypothetical protein